MSLHLAYGFRLHNEDMADAVMVSALSAQEAQTGTEVLNDVDAGSPHPRHVAIVAQRPQATATPKDLAVAFGLVGSEGSPIKAGIVETVLRPGLDFFQLSIDPTTGKPFTTEVHRRINIQRGILVPQQLSCEHQADATLDLAAFAIADPEDDGEIGEEPLHSFADVAAPTGLAGGERWTIGPVSVAGETIDCNLRVEVDFGITIETEGCNSDIHDPSLFIASIQPQITIRGKNIKKFVSATIPLKGKGATHANTSIMLRKRLQTEAGFVADATAEHIELTAAGVAYWDSVHSAQGNARVEDSLVISCRHDGTNVPIIIDTTATIS